MKSAVASALPISGAKERSSFSALLRRVYEALLVSRQRQADREIARMLHLNGAVMTDAAEREIERRFGFRA